MHQLTLVEIGTLDCGKRLAKFPQAEVLRANKIATLPEFFALADSYWAPDQEGVRYNIEAKVKADQPGGRPTPDSSST